MNKPRLDGLTFNSITERQVKVLEREFDEAEIKSALDSLAIDKTLGPQGFRWRFIAKDGIS